MIYKKVEKPKLTEIVPGVWFEPILEGTRVSEILFYQTPPGAEVYTLTLEKVAFLRIKHEGYSGLELQIPGPLPTKEAHKITGTMLGKPFEELFDSYSEAVDRKKELEEHMMPGDELTYSCVNVPDIEWSNSR